MMTEHLVRTGERDERLWQDAGKGQGLVEQVTGKSIRLKCLGKEAGRWWWPQRQEKCMEKLQRQTDGDDLMGNWGAEFSLIGWRECRPRMCEETARNPSRATCKKKESSLIPTALWIDLYSLYLVWETEKAKMRAKNENTGPEFSHTWRKQLFRVVLVFFLTPFVPFYIKLFWEMGISISM